MRPKGLRARLLLARLWPCRQRPPPAVALLPLPRRTAWHENGLCHGELRGASPPSSCLPEGSIRGAGHRVSLSTPSPAHPEALPMAAEGERPGFPAEAHRGAHGPRPARRRPQRVHPASRRPGRRAAAAGDALLRERLAALEPRPWHASGAFDPPAPPTLSFTSAEGKAVTLPLGGGRPDAELQPLLAVASPSPFAKQGKTVVDAVYRDARELLPGAFESSVALPPKVRAAGGEAGGRGASSTRRSAALQQHTSALVPAGLSACNPCQA